MLKTNMKIHSVTDAELNKNTHKYIHKGITAEHSVTEIINKGGIDFESPLLEASKNIGNEIHQELENFFERFSHKGCIENLTKHSDTNYNGYQYSYDSDIGFNNEDVENQVRCYIAHVRDIIIGSEFVAMPEARSIAAVTADLGGYYETNATIGMSADLLIKSYNDEVSEDAPYDSIIIEFKTTEQRDTKHLVQLAAYVEFLRVKGEIRGDGKAFVVYLDGAVELIIDEENPEYTSYYFDKFKKCLIDYKNEARMVEGEDARLLVELTIKNKELEDMVATTKEYIKSLKKQIEESLTEAEITLGYMATDGENKIKVSNITKRMPTYDTNLIKEKLPEAIKYNISTYSTTKIIKK